MANEYFRIILPVERKGGKYINLGENGHELSAEAKRGFAKSDGDRSGWCQVLPPPRR